MKVKQQPSRQRHVLRLAWREYPDRETAMHALQHRIDDHHEQLVGTHGGALDLIHVERTFTTDTWNLGASQVGGTAEIEYFIVAQPERPTRWWQRLRGDTTIVRLERPAVAKLVRRGQ